MLALEAPSLRVWVQCILVDRHRLKKELIVGRVNGKASMATATSLAACTAAAAATVLVTATL